MLLMARSHNPLCRRENDRRNATLGQTNPSVVLLESPLHIHFCTWDFGIRPDVIRGQSTLSNDRLHNL